MAQEKKGTRVFFYSEKQNEMVKEMGREVSLPSGETKKLSALNCFVLVPPKGEFPGGFREYSETSAKESYPKGVNGWGDKPFYESDDPITLYHNVDTNMRFLSKGDKSAQITIEQRDRLEAAFVAANTPAKNLAKAQGGFDNTLNEMFPEEQNI